MDKQSIDELITEFAQAQGRTEFAISQAIKQLETRRKKETDENDKQYIKDIAIANNKAADSLSTAYLCIKNEVKKFNEKDQSIVQAAEFINPGYFECPQAQKLCSEIQKIPYIIPFWGKNNVLFIGKDEAMSDVIPGFVWEIISNTAPGQVETIIYNPHLNNDLSVFTVLDAVRTLTKPDELQDLFDSLSQDIVAIDALLNGKATSLLELRSLSQQPVGVLKLVIFQNMDFLSDKSLCDQYKKVVANCCRAGIGFICCSTERSIKQYGNDLSSFVVLRLNGENWIDEDTSNNVFFSIKSSKELVPYIKMYQEQIDKTSVTTIPFSQIEDTDNEWHETSAHGISFAIGKNGLDIVSLRIGDSKTQLHNILISGAVGKGKSNLIEVIIHSICARYSPDEIEFYLLDFKDGLTFKPYGISDDGSLLPHVKVLGLESERDAGLATLSYIEKVRKERAKTFKNAGDYKGIGTYRDAFPDQIIPQIILIIDEYQKLFEVNDDIGEESAKLLENIVRQGRAFGIHVILASQSISGAAALLGKEDRIYAQFPVRIALQNSITESYATFVNGNDAAAKLRVRGEAILNENYGDINSNIKFSVAFADPHEMGILRKKWYAKWDNKYIPPVIFRKDEKVHISSIITNIKQWRKNIQLQSISPILPCGICVSVNKTVLSVRCSNDPGRNLALLGAGEDIMNIEENCNIAIGMLQSIAISLALQHADGNAQFTLINCLDKATAERNNIKLWLSLMERFGYFVDVVENNDAGKFFIETEKDLESQKEEQAHGFCHYIICLALDRCNSLNYTDENDDDNADFLSKSLLNTSENGLSAFQKIIQIGSAKGTHILSWWTNATVFQGHIGFGGDGYFNTKILLRMDGGTAQSILGPFTKWNVQDNRALVHDSLDLDSNITIIPFVPIQQRDCGLLEAEDWNT